MNESATFELTKMMVSRANVLPRKNQVYIAMKRERSIHSLLEIILITRVMSGISR